MPQSAINFNKHLKNGVLSVDDLNLKKEDIKELTKFIQVKPTDFLPKALFLRECGIYGPHGKATRLAKGNVTSLSMNEDDYLDNLEIMQHSLNNSDIVFFKISVLRPILGIKNAKKMFTSLKYITHLMIHYSYQFPSNEIPFIASMKNLVSLKISAGALDSRAARKLAELVMLEQLQELCIPYNMINNTGMNALIATKSKVLKALDVSYNGISKVKNINQLHSLEILSIARNEDDLEYIHYIGIREISKLSFLRALDISNNKIDYAAIRVIVNQLPDLMFLKVNQNPNMGYNGIAALLELKKLEQLGVAKCELGDKEIKIIADKLLDNDNKLIYIDLFNNCHISSIWVENLFILAKLKDIKIIYLNPDRPHIYDQEPAQIYHQVLEIYNKFFNNLSKENRKNILKDMKDKIEDPDHCRYLVEITHQAINCLTNQERDRIDDARLTLYRQDHLSNFTMAESFFKEGAIPPCHHMPLPILYIQWTCIRKLIPILVNQLIEHIENHQELKSSLNNVKPALEKYQESREEIPKQEQNIIKIINNIMIRNIQRDADMKRTWPFCGFVRDGHTYSLIIEGLFHNAILQEYIKNKEQPLKSDCSSEYSPPSKRM